MYSYRNMFWLFRNFTPQLKETAKFRHDSINTIATWLGKDFPHISHDFLISISRILIKSLGFELRKNDGLSNHLLKAMSSANWNIADDTWVVEPELLRVLDGIRKRFGIAIHEKDYEGWDYKPLIKTTADLINFLLRRGAIYQQR